MVMRRVEMPQIRAARKSAKMPKSDERCEEERAMSAQSADFPVRVPRVS